jgi:hypothetical protein
MVENAQMELAGREALLERLITGRTREIVFLVGSPLTAPADASPHGVPGVAAMVKRIQDLVRDHPRSLEELNARLATSQNPYQTAFHYVSERRGQDTANALIRSAVLEARLENARPPDPVDDATCQQLEGDLEGWHFSPAWGLKGDVLLTADSQPVKTAAEAIQRTEGAPGSPVCVLRSMPITRSGACRSLVPEHADHLFRPKPITGRSLTG